jgi:hypothetical protein
MNNTAEFKNIIINNDNSSEIVRDVNFDSEPTYPFFNNRISSNKLFVASTAILMGSQFAFSNPIIDIGSSEKKLETVLLEYKTQVELPTSHYLKEINSIQKYRFTKKALISEILSFKFLKVNWDGYGAIPLEIGSAVNSITFINSVEDKTISMLSDILPNPNGTITFIWENNSDEIMSLEIGNKTFSYYFSLLNNETIFVNNVTIDKKNISKIENFIEQL